jgi:hypothetical protein
MPLEAIGKDLSKDLASLDVTLASATKLLNNADAHIVPPLKTALEDAHNTLVAVERAMNNVNATILGPAAPAQQELRSALQDFARAAVLTSLEPAEPVIRGKTDATRKWRATRKPVRHRCFHGGMFFVAFTLLHAERHGRAGRVIELRWS